MKPIYLDFNATTPIDPEVAEAMLPYLHEHFGNPSSSHWFGLQARKAVEQARQQVAALLGCAPEEIIFTSGGSEANNMAIKGVAFRHQHKGNHIITSTVEHPAVIEVCKYLQERGFETSYLPVDQFGLVDPQQLEQAIRPQTILITIMHANNEVGTIQPVGEIGAIARGHSILCHTDAAQSVGKIPTRVSELQVDLLSVAGHKLHAPKGVGALYVRKGTELDKLIHGASQEQNLRAGTENVSQIVGLGKACDIAARNMASHMKHMQEMRDLLFHTLQERIPELRLNGHPQQRLPNTLSVGFKNVAVGALLSEVTEIAASAGAACHASTVTISPVLEAMSVPLEYAAGTVRFSTGRTTTREEILQAADSIVQAVRRLAREKDRTP
ncbi:MAG: cysteine desulfurase [Deltaproteobacteria bacterium]|nr:cysteine desulfurase [Deltaproteobacteria bacterium]MBW2070818.1 cysteine desulfurase [Deltaproteobacteria bacterium]